MNEQQHAEILIEKGLYNTYSAVRALNEGKRKENRINKTEFYRKLRRAGFLSTGMRSKPHDPTHNKPFKWIREKGWAKIERHSFIKKGTENKEDEYSVATYTIEGLKIIEKIINNPDFSLQALRHETEKPKPTPAPTTEEKKLNQKAGAEAIKNLTDLLQAS